MTDEIAPWSSDQQPGPVLETGPADHAHPTPGGDHADQSDPGGPLAPGVEDHEDRSYQLVPMGKGSGPLLPVDWSEAGPSDFGEAYDGTGPLPEVVLDPTMVVPLPVRLKDRTEATVRSAPDQLKRTYWSAWPGVVALKDRTVTWADQPMTERSWQLEDHKARGPAGHQDWEALRAQLTRQRAERRLTALGAWAAAVLILFALVIVVLGCLGLVLAVVLGPLVLGIIGRRVAGPSDQGSGPPAGPIGPGPKDQPVLDGPAADQPVLPEPIDDGPLPEDQPRLSKESIAEALHGAGVVRADQQRDAITIHELRRRRFGWSCIVNLPGAISASKAINAIDAITASLGTDQDCLKLDRVPGKNGHLFVYLADEDPLSGKPVRSPLPNLNHTNLWQANGQPLGYTIRGELLCHDPLTHTLVAGGSGSGKTLTLRTIEAGKALDPVATFIVGDPQNLAGWKPWAQLGRVYAGTDPAVVEAFLADLQQLLNVEIPRRQKILNDLIDAGKLPLLEEPMLPAEVVRDPAHKLSVVNVVVDEAHLYFRGDLAGPFEFAFQQLIARGRALLIVVDMATQKPTGDHIPTSVSGLFQTRYCHAASEQMARAALDDQAFRQSGPDPTQLKAKIHTGAFRGQGSGTIIHTDYGRRVGATVLARADLSRNSDIAACVAKGVDLRRRLRRDLLPTGRSVIEIAPSEDASTVLVHLLDVFAREGAEDVLPAVLVEGLKKDHPDRYRRVPTNGLSQLLLYGPEGDRRQFRTRTGPLATHQRIVEPETKKRPRRLNVHDVREALTVWREQLLKSDS